jgi:parallel beta-helix repeat protein
MFRSLMIMILAALMLTACGDDENAPACPSDEPSDYVCGGFDPPAGGNTCADFDTANCVEIPAGDVDALLNAVNTLGDDSTVILAAGTYELDNAVTIRDASGVNFVGQGIDVTILDFAATVSQTNGIDVVGDDFLVQDLTVANVVKDGIRVENSDGVTFRRIKATWDGGASSDNGAYGIYPVKSKNVLVEDSIAEFTADAGLYVGQCINVIVRCNHVKTNVAGLEIENTQYADVYKNLAEDNTAGIVVFDLPGNPVIGRDVRIRDNIIRNNNHENFAPGGVVAEIPPGTGTFALASRRVEIINNTYENNRTGSIAILSGLLIEPEASWRLERANVIGDIADLDLPGDDTYVYNYRSEEVVITGNTITVDEAPEPNSQELGILLYVVYGPTLTPTDHVIYDGVGETIDPSNPSASTNENRIFVGQDSFAVLGVGFSQTGQIVPPTSLSALARFAAPDSFAPYACQSLTAGRVVVPDDLP